MTQDINPRVNTGSSRIDQAGVRQFVAGTWDGLFAPARTPPAIVDKINNDLRVVVNEQAASLRARGMEPAVTSPAEFRSFIRSEIEKWTYAAKRAGIEQ